MSNTIGFNNFKAFGSKMQYFSKKPITLVYGPNSIGKSSLIHSQVYQHLLFEHNENDVEQTFIAGDELDLGGFENYVHKHNIDSDIDFEWKIRDKKEILEFFEFQDIENINELNIKFKVKKEQSVDFLVLRKFISFYLNENFLFTAVVILDDFDITNANYKYLNEYLSINKGEELREVFKKVFANKIKSDIQYFSPIRHYPERFELDRFIGHKAIELSFYTYMIMIPFSLMILLIFLRDHVVELRVFIEPIVDLIFFPFMIFIVFMMLIFSYYVGQYSIKSNENEIGKINKFLPKRLHFKRKSFLSSYNVWEEISKYNRLIKQLNLWLSDPNKLKSTYRIKVEKYQISIIDSFYYKVSKLFNMQKFFFKNCIVTSKDNKLSISWSIFNTISNMRIKTVLNLATGDLNDTTEMKDSSIKEEKGKLKNSINSISKFRRYLENKFCPQKNRIKRVVFQDIQQNTLVTPKDMGLGISQALPILASLFSSKNKMHYIEQPELHLHPAVQMELMDEFIRSYHDNNNEFMLESHSEHMLLRVMKRMRHTANGTLEDKSLRLTPDDVCLLYVDNNGNTTYVKELELDYDGTLLDPWPKGFFEEGHKERFE